MAPVASLSKVEYVLLPVSVACGNMDRGLAKRLAQVQGLLGKGAGEAVGKWRNWDRLQDWG